MKKIIALWVFMLSMIFSGSCFAEDFVYHQYDDGTAYVFSYEGTSEYVRIPSEYNGCKVTRIGTRALCLPWETDNKVQEVEIEPGIEVIGASAFRNMSNLISVSLPDTIKIIEDHAFFNCTSLSKIELPEGLTEIQFGAFEKCTSLEEITIPDSVEIIEGRAFYGCTNLKEIHIGDRDIIIRGKAFAETAWDDNTTGYGILGKTLVSCHQNRSQGTVPKGITGIADNAFEDDIKRLHISPDVKWIGSGILTEIESFTGGENLERVYASASWDWNYKLPSRDTPLIIGHVLLRYTGDAESVTIPEGVTCIASVAFAGSSVKEVIIPESVEYIGDQVFVNAANLKSVNIPKMVKEIGENPFLACGAASDCSVSSESERFIIENGFLLDVEKQRIISCLIRNNEEILIPDQIRVIGASALRCCNNLKTIWIPESVRELESDAFSECNALTEITIPDAVNRIGDCVFQSCSNLRTVVFGQGITDLGSSTFENDFGLEFVQVGEDVKSMEYARIKEKGSEYSPLLSVAEGSYAQKYAEEEGIRYTTEYLESARESKRTRQERAETVYNKYFDLGGFRFWCPEYVIYSYENGAHYLDMEENQAAYMGFWSFDMNCTLSEFENTYDFGSEYVKSVMDLYDTDGDGEIIQQVTADSNLEIPGCFGFCDYRYDGYTADVKFYGFYNIEAAQYVVICTFVREDSEYLYNNVFDTILHSMEYMEGVESYSSKVWALTENYYNTYIRFKEMTGQQDFYNPEYILVCQDMYSYVQQMNDVNDSLLDEQTEQYYYQTRQAVEDDAVLSGVDLSLQGLVDLLNTWGNTY